jgi:CheY-like chemotaxis protein
VGNGTAALDWLRHSARPGLILLDLTMPVLDGWQFRQAQGREGALASIPVFLLSAEGNLHDIAAALRVAGYFAKPVEFSDLLTAIRVMDEDSGPQTAEHSVPAAIGIHSTG